MKKELLLMMVVALFLSTKNLSAQNVPTLEWEKSLGGESWDNAYNIAQTSDGGFIVAGRTKSNNDDVFGNHGSYDCWIVKLDAYGNIIWQETLGGHSDDGANSIQQTIDGGFIVAGYTFSHTGNVTVN